MDIDTDRCRRVLDGASPAQVVAWAGETFGESCVAAVSFQSPVLPHLVATHAPQIPLVFLDTGYHFPETLRYLEKLQALLGVSVSVTDPPLPLDDQWRSDPDGCCQARKVRPLEQVLAGRAAFLSGVRWVDHSGRTTAEVISRDPRFNVYRVQPLVTMTDADVEEYIEAHDLPTHPLQALGYTSIGCWPCTSPVAAGEHPRAGRWRGSEKNECGINDAYGSRAS